MLIPTLEGVSDYLIYFDHVRMDKYVIGFGTQISNNGSIGRATINMMPFPELYTDIKPLTNVRIFVKNVFTDKYLQVFEGEIRSRNRYISRNGDVIQFQATDYLNWIDTVPVPIMFGTDAATNSLLKFSWAAQNIDLENTDFFKDANQYNFSGKNLKTIIDSIIGDLYKGNSQFHTSNTLANWIELNNKIAIHGDIDPAISAQKQYFNLIFQGIQQQSLYVMLNNLIQQIMFEMYQDRDGVVRIKPPYWQDGVLLNHVIDPLLMIEFNESIEHDKEPTRVIVQGGTNAYTEQAARANKDQGIFVPIGVYFGDTGTWISNNDVFGDVTTYEGSPTANINTEGLDSDLRKFLNKVSIYMSALEQASAVCGLRVEFLLALMFHESHGDPKAVSPAGAIGIMQIMPGTAAGLGVDPWDPYDSIRGTGLYFANANAVQVYEGNLALIAAGYNAGWGGINTALKKAGISQGMYKYVSAELVKPFLKAETQKYMDLLVGTYNKLTGTNSTVSRPTLQLGSTGSDVKLVQQLLDAKAYYDNTTYTGVFDQYTLTGVKRFQQDNGLSVTGVVNDETWDALLKGSGNAGVSYKGNYDKLAVLTPYEKQVGVKAIKAEQPLISKGNNTPEDAFKLLGKYAAYLYNFLKATATNATVTTVAAPWLRPGFNVWVDPVKVNTVYYINSVSHTGNAQSGVTTSLGLTHPRPISEIAITPGGDPHTKRMGRSDYNTFYLPDYVSSHTFGKMLDTTADFDNAKSYVQQWYNLNKQDVSTRARENSYFRHFYTDQPPSMDGHFLNFWSIEHTAEEIEAKLQPMYTTSLGSTHPVRVRAGWVEATKKKLDNDVTSRYHFIPSN